MTGKILYREDVFTGKLDQQLISAIKNGDTERVEAILKLGANPGKPDPAGRTPMHLAALGGQTGIIKALFNRKANVNARDEELVTPLHCAAWNGHADAATTLMDLGASPSAADIDNETPMHNAAETNSVSVLKALMVRTADMYTKNNRDMTPWELAEARGNQQAAQYLKDADAYVRKQLAMHMRPLEQGKRLLAAPGMKQPG